MYSITIDDPLYPGNVLLCPLSLLSEECGGPRLTITTLAILENLL